MKNRKLFFSNVRKPPSNLKITDKIPLGPSVGKAWIDNSGNLVTERYISDELIGKTRKGKKLWFFDGRGNCVMEQSHNLPLPFVHMLAAGTQCYSICDHFLRGYFGIDYTRMFGEFDGHYFPKDQGRFVWVRSREDKSCWCVNYAPQRRIEPDSFVSTFGMGFASIENESKNLGLKGKISVFVPLKDKVEYWIVEIENTGAAKREIDLICAVPVFGGSRHYTEYHRDVVRLYNKTACDGKKGSIKIKPGIEWVEGRSKKSGITYFLSAVADSGKKPDRYYTDRESFLGPHQRWSEPLSILADIPPIYEMLGEEAVGAAQFSSITLKPGEKKCFVVQNGIGITEKESDALIRKNTYRNAVSELNRVKDFWDRNINRKKIETLDRDFDISWNKWWYYQLSMRRWFGNTGHPEFDYGTDFSGWREIWQDMIGAILVDAESVESQLLDTLSGIRIDGTNATRFFARTGKFGSDKINGLWCDHPYWTAQTVLLFADYIGKPDYCVREKAPYFRDLYLSRGDLVDKNWVGDVTGFAKDKRRKKVFGTVLEHILLQNLTMFFDCGKNGFLSIKRADWNDGMDQLWGESVTFTMGNVQNFRDIADYLLKLKGRKAVSEVELMEEMKILLGGNTASPAERKKILKKFIKKVDGGVSGRKIKISADVLIKSLRKKESILKNIINKKAWNGEYYTGYFYKNGKPVDTKFSAAEFEINLMPQSFSIMSGVADGEKAGRVIKSVDKYLRDRKIGGLKLNYPPYREFNPGIGRLTGFAPGTKENNAVFNHANLFWIYAMMLSDKPVEAFRVWNGINPLNHEQTEAKIPPFLPEYWVSEDNGRISGRGEYPLLTGSAVWTRIIFERYVIGFRSCFDGIVIDPKIPAGGGWENVRFYTKFRGADYVVNIQNPTGKAFRKIDRILVNGREHKGPFISPDTKEKKVFIEVLLK
ncbi:MAG: hypothetical protein PHO00_04600 [bacterium]|nr:hypothetical protein [bacterium]